MLWKHGGVGSTQADTKAQFVTVPFGRCFGTGKQASQPHLPAPSRS